MDKDKIGLQLAKKYGMEDEFIEMRMMGFSVEDTLEEWDLFDIEATLLQKKQDGLTNTNEQ